MKMLLFFLFLIPFAFAFNETQNITFNNSINDSSNDVEFNYSHIENLNESYSDVVVFEDESEVYEDLNFFIRFYLEGDEYFLDLFEFLLDSSTGLGQEYNASFFTDEQSSSKVSFSGDEYSGSAGGYGFLSSPVVSVSPYCGDSSCDSGESCSNCPGDCGVCVVESPGSSSGGGSTGDYIVVENNDFNDSSNGEVISKIPSALFDIKMDLEDVNIESSRDLVLLVSYENFGRDPVNVNLSFKILNSFGGVVYEKTDSLNVVVEEFRRYYFDDLDLSDGDYEVLFSVFYLDSEKLVKDEFIQSFVVSSNLFIEFNYLIYALIVTGVIILFFIIKKIIFALKKKALHKNGNLRINRLKSRTEFRSKISKIKEEVWE